ncbi:MAG: hypothetical protein JWQ35_1132 [Bacteriovoracaceae bacterium]|nr:hypothetical protein [Bacteriovoracaceae bacterium]
MKRRLQIFGTFLVTLFLITGISLLYHDLYSLISQQRSILEKTAYTISRLLPTASIELSSETKDSHTSNDSQLQDLLFSLQTDLNIVGGIFIVSSKPPFQVLSSTKVGFRKGDHYEIPPLDSSLSDAKSTNLYRRDGGFRLSAFAPIRDASGEVVASLALESDESAFILRLIGYGLHYLLLALGLITIGGFIFLWISNRTSLSLKKLKERYFTLFAESSDGILIIDSKGQIQKLNKAALETFERTEHQMIGKNLFKIDAEDFNFIPLEVDKNIQNRTLSLNLHFRSKAKLILEAEKIRYLNYSSYPLSDGKDVAGALIIFQDITSDFIREQELHHDQVQLRSENLQLQQQVITDPLTHTLNKQYLYYILDEKNLKWMSVEGCSMLVIDIDNFKQVNDIQGHARGDEVLQSFAKFLRGFFRRSDKIIRFGGDEFIVILPRTNIQSAARIANNMKEKLAKDFANTPSNILTVSVGVAELQPRENGHAWMNRADKALYQAKHSGKNAIQTDDFGELEVLN